MTLYFFIGLLINIRNNIKYYYSVLLYYNNIIIYIICLLITYVKTGYYLFCYLQCFDIFIIAAG